MKTPGLSVLIKVRSYLAALVMLGSLQAVAQGGEEVKDDSTWSGGDVTVTVDIEQHSSANTVTVTFTDAEGTSPAAQGTPGESSSESAPTASDSGTATTPGEDGTSYRISDGKVQRKNDDGQWVNMRRKTKKDAGGSIFLRANEPAPRRGTLRSPFQGSVPLVRGQLAPFTGQFFPGEEVGTLPQ